MTFNPDQPEIEPTFMERRLDDIQTLEGQLADIGHEMTDDQRCAVMDDIFNFKGDVARVVARDETGSNAGQFDAGESDYMDRVCMGQENGTLSRVLSRLLTF